MRLIENAAIFGAAGSIGPVVGAEFDRLGIPFRAVGRNRESLETTFAAMPRAEIFPADLGDLRAAAAAARSVDTIVYTIGLPYPSHSRFPALMRTAIEAAVSMKVRRFVLVSNIYSYGVPRSSTVPETHPRQPVARKGEYRKEQEDLLLDAHQQRRLDALILRLPDFYGPGADKSLANPVFQAALSGKTANWIGPVNTAHEFVYIPDTGPVIASLASTAECYGEAWHFAGPGSINSLDFITRIYRAAGQPPKYRTAGRGILKAMGWFSPLMAELPEMLYLQETPVILDDSKLLNKFPGIRKTSYDDGIRQTLEWMRRPG
jgi:nucleoside-diphosphate-sugar epimerase